MVGPLNCVQPPINFKLPLRTLKLPVLKMPVSDILRATNVFGTQII